MKNLGTTPASTNDLWSAYTHIEVGGRSFEIRHPKGKNADGSDKLFCIFRWNDQTGLVYYGANKTLESAIDRLRG